MRLWVSLGLLLLLSVGCRDMDQTRPLRIPAQRGLFHIHLLGEIGDDEPEALARYSEFVPQREPCAAWWANAQVPQAHEEGLRALGLDQVGLGGPALTGLDLQELQRLDDRFGAMGVSSFGWGADRFDALKGTVTRHLGLKIGWLGFTSTRRSEKSAGTGLDGFAHSPLQPGLAPLRVDVVGQAVADLRPRVDLLIVMIGWEDGPPAISDRQRRLARAAIDAGADAAIGARRGVGQGVEIHNGRPIVYSAEGWAVDLEIVHSRVGSVGLRDATANRATDKGLEKRVRRLQQTTLGDGSKAAEAGRLFSVEGSRAFVRLNPMAR